VTKTLCAWCETPSSSAKVCSNCHVSFSCHRYSEEDMRHAAVVSPLPEEYSPEERAAFRVLNHLTAMEGSR
jgi:hypothetical protein